MNPEEVVHPMDYQDWLSTDTNQKVEASHLNYLASIRDSAESGLGQFENRHLNYFAESIFVNVGGSYLEMSSPSMKSKSVGGFIVVGARESRVHGEGS